VAVGRGEAIAESGLTGGVTFQIKAGPNDMKGMQIQVDQDGVQVKERYVALEQEGLPANLAPAGTAGHGFADAYFVLAAGKYRVRVTPMNSETEPSALCQPAEKDVEVFASETTEVVLVAQCDSPDNGGLDVIVTTNHDPVISDLLLAPSKFVLTCEKLKATLTVQEPDNDPLTYAWEVTKKPVKGNFEMAWVNNVFQFMSRSAGDYEIKAKVCDKGLLCSSLSFPIHVSMSKDANQNGLGDECEVTPHKLGRVVTMLLTMSNPRTMNHPTKNIPFLLAENSIAWVSAEAQPKIVVVRDDNHQGEFRNDPEFVQLLLLQAGFAVDLIEEPAQGLTWDLVKNYQVLWFSNPGHDVDDAESVTVMKRWVDEGRGLILQGDDMAWNASLQPLTHLRFADNGTLTCGRITNDNLGKDYQVTFNKQEHPVLKGLQSVAFLYGDDIDHATAIGQGEVVLAAATLNPADRCDVLPCGTWPTVIAYDPNIAP